MTTRPAAVAGLFYPASAPALARAVGSFLDGAHTAASPRCKAIIAPHAGYVYSGATAGEAYHCLASAPDDTVTRVVVVAPAHRVWVPAPTLPSAAALATPLGVVPVADVDETLGRFGVRHDDRPHEKEHAVEVHLPFIQTLFPRAEVVPLVASETEPERMADLLAALWGGDETRIVISSDLSHFHSYDEARARDRRTCERIVALDPRPLDGEDACGAVGINGLVRLATRLHLTPRLVALCNSGDTAGRKEEVVGYGAIAFEADAH